MSVAYDFQIRAGNSGTVSNPAGLVFSLKDANGVDEDLTGSEFVFFANDGRSTELIKTSAEGVGFVGGTVTVPFTVEDSRVFKAGKSVDYEVEQRNGTSQRTRFSGKMSVVKSINND